MKKLKNLDLSFSLSLGQIITILIGIVWGIIYVVGILKYGFWVGGYKGVLPPLLGCVTFITTISLISLTIATTVVYIVQNWNKNIINFKIKKE